MDYNSVEGALLLRLINLFRSEVPNAKAELNIGYRIDTYLSILTKPPEEESSSALRIP